MSRVFLVCLLALMSLVALPSAAVTQTDLTGQMCPDWVHDQYVAEGPDGQLYSTWHAPIDPQYGCYFNHEHGSDPALASPEIVPLFGYTGAQHGMDEPHEGFKTYVFDGNDGTRWVVTHHMGTYGAGRACTRFHTLDIAVTSYGHKSWERGHKVVDVHLMADFGRGEVWDGNGGIPVTPAACPDNPNVASDGVRRFPDASNGAIGYEVWRVATKPLAALGITFQSVHIGSDQPMRICADAVCDEMVVRNANHKGLQRWINGLITIDNPGSSDYFTTDAHGTGAGSVPQFIQTEEVWTTVGHKCKDVGVGVAYCHTNVNMVNEVNPAYDTSFLVAPN